jgi:hypothetical protein
VLCFLIGGDNAMSKKTKIFLALVVLVILLIPTSKYIYMNCHKEKRTGDGSLCVYKGACEIVPNIDIK